MPRPAPTQVVLPRGRHPRMAPVCAVCGGPEMGALLTVQVHLRTAVAALGHVVGLPGAGLTRRNEARLSFPCCGRCLRRHRRRNLRAGLIYGVWVAFGMVALVGPWLGLPASWRIPINEDWAVGACLLLFLGPVLIYLWFVRSPDPVYAEETNTALAVTFSNPDVAEAFARANDW